MPSATIPLEYDTYYHIYNRGIDGCNLYRETDDYKHFLKLYEKYIEPVADTFAWVLMPNHFHLLIRIKSEKEIGIYKHLNSDGSKDSVRFQTQPSVSQSSKNLIELVSKSQIPQNTFHIFLMPAPNTLIKSTNEQDPFSNALLKENW
ncbi:hypothetical protein [Labilibaculum manganireducens]|uniref:hypothetical protein n=1 Tax=Labilibaculum manganireducens TaxID=1940525 RepID=UPI0029F4D43D|nr:hypothetical protein [Labilibaculum manganireducens]